jgi:hypothetical protein
MTAAAYRAPLLALSLAVAVVSALPALALVWAPTIAISFNRPALLLMVGGPVLWLALVIALLVLFRKGALVALLGLPFVSASIALIGFVLVDPAAFPAPAGEYHIVKSEIFVK